MSEDELEQRFRETELQINGLSCDISRIRSGEPLPLQRTNPNVFQPTLLHSPKSKKHPKSPTGTLSQFSVVERGRGHLPQNSSAYRYPIRPKKSVHYSDNDTSIPPMFTTPGKDKKTVDKKLQQKQPSLDVCDFSFDSSDSTESNFSLNTTSSTENTKKVCENETTQTEDINNGLVYLSPPDTSREHTPKSYLKEFPIQRKTSVDYDYMIKKAECEEAELNENEKRKTEKSLVQQVQRESDERFRKETFKLQQDLNDKHKMNICAMDSEYSKKLERLRKELEDERDIRQEERTKASLSEQQLLIEMSKLKETVHELNLQEQTINQDFAMLQNRLVHKEKMIEDLQQQNYQLQTTLTTLESMKSTLENQFRSEKREHSRLQCDFEHAQNQLSQLSSEHRALEASLDEIQKKRSTLEHESFILTNSTAELKEELIQANTLCHTTQSRLDHVEEENAVLKNRFNECEKDLQLKTTMYETTLEQLEQCKHREHILKQDMARYMQKLSEKEDDFRELIRNKRELDSACSLLKDQEAQITTLNNELKHLQNQTERDVIEMHKLKNDLFSLTQENVKLRKELKQLKQTDSTQGFQKKSLNKQRNLTRSQYLSTTVLPTAITTESTKDAIKEWDLKPPSTIPLFGGGGGTKAPEYVDSFTEQQQMSTVSKMSSQLIGSGCIIPKAPTPSSILHIEGLEKQLMLLQAEKSQIESELLRLPSYSRGYTMKQRETRSQGEERLKVVESSINQIRYELRLNQRRRCLY